MLALAGLAVGLILLKSLPSRRTPGSSGGTRRSAPTRPGMPDGGGLSAIRPSINFHRRRLAAEPLRCLRPGTRVMQAWAELGVAVGGIVSRSSSNWPATIYTSPATRRPSTSATHAAAWTDAVGFQAGWKSISGASSGAGGIRGRRLSGPRSLPTTTCWSRCWATWRRPTSALRTLQREIAIAEENVVRQREAVRITRARFEQRRPASSTSLQAENVLGATEAAVRS